VWAWGLVCVEAAGNGAEDLDDPSWGGLFDRQTRDSGAIIVVAGLPHALRAESFTTYGRRIDAHAWGSQIVTTGYGDLYNGGTLQTRYTATFGGTSGASQPLRGRHVQMARRFSIHRSAESLSAWHRDSLSQIADRCQQIGDLRCLWATGASAHSASR